MPDGALAVAVTLGVVYHRKSINSLRQFLGLLVEYIYCTRWQLKDLFLGAVFPRV